MEEKYDHVYYYRCNNHPQRFEMYRESPGEARLDMVAHYVAMKRDPRAGSCQLDLCEIRFQYRDMTT